MLFIFRFIILLIMLNIKNLNAQTSDTIRYFYSSELKFFYQDQNLNYKELFALIGDSITEQKGFRKGRYHASKVYYEFVKGLGVFLVSYPLLAASTESDLHFGYLSILSGVLLANLKKPKKHDDRLVALIKAYNSSLKMNFFEKPNLAPL